MDERTVREEFERRIKASERAMVRRWERSLENHQFVAGGKKQWDEKVYRARTNSGRSVWSINDCALAANAISGQQITRRFERRFLGRSDEDHAAAEAVTAADQKVRDVALAEHVESDKFRDLAIEGIACLEWYMDYLDDFRGSARVRGHDTWAVMFDPTAREHNLVDREWDAVGKWMSRHEFLGMYPDREEELERYVGNSGTWISHDDMKESARWPWLHRVHGRSVDQQRREVFVVDYQYRVREPIWIVEVPRLDPATRGPQVGPTGQPLADLQALNREEWLDYRADHLRQTGVEPNVVSPDMGAHRWQYRQAIILGHKVLRDAPLRVGSFTRLFLTGFPVKSMEDVEFYGAIDYMADAQRFKNGTINLFNSLLARSMKGGMVYDPNAFQASGNELAGLVAQPFPMIPTKPGALSGGAKLWENLPVSGFPTGLEPFLELADTAVWRPLGMNPSILGSMMDMRRVSPRVLSSVAEAASVVMSTLFNSLRLYRQMSGRLMLRFFREFYEADRLAAIVGPKRAGSIPTDADQWEAFLDHDVIVDESQATTRDERAELWELLSRHGVDRMVQAGLMPPKILAELAPGITESQRKEWITWLEGMQKEQQAQAQLEQLMQILAAVPGGDQILAQAGVAAPPQAAA